MSMTEFTNDPRPETAAGAAENAADGLNVPDARRNLVKMWVERVEKAKKHFEKEFKAMEENEQIAAEGADKEWVNSKQYVAPILKRHIDQAVAQLYAKNPTASAKRRKRLMYQLWDGKPMSLEAAYQAATPPKMVDPATGAQVVADPLWQPDPNAVALLQEVVEAQQYNQMADKAGKTLECLWNYFAGEQAAGFKLQMKALVRRTKVTGVGYVKLAFQRAMQKRPEDAARIDDVTNQMASIEKLMKDAADGSIEEDSARMEELRLLLKQLQALPEVIVREGPVFDFPASRSIIVDPMCRHLKTFTGARWVAHEFDLTPEQIDKIYKVNVRESFKDHCTVDGKSVRNWEAFDDPKKKASLARVYEIQDIENGQFLTVCSGYPEFLKEPAEPDVKIERFWTIFPLVFNEIEHENKLYPPSDVYLARHQQQEYNRSREGLREHRIAARPKYAMAKGAMEENDKKKLASGTPHEVLELKALKPGQSIEQLLQVLKGAPIDPNMYEVNQVFQDLQRVVGSQEANIGGTSDASATESSIAESSRTASLAENVDDLDEMLSSLAHATGQLMLHEMSKEMVVEIAGPGAVWPDVQGNRVEIAKDLVLEIKAGSSGRPNRAAELAALERGMPYIIQLPGAPIKPLVKKYMDLLEIDMDDAEVENLPSIVAINQMMAKAAAQPGTGDPATDPSAQGAQGGQNAPKPGGNEPQGQPAMPAGPAGAAPGAPAAPQT